MKAGSAITWLRLGLISVFFSSLTASAQSWAYADFFSPTAPAVPALTKQIKSGAPLEVTGVATGPGFQGYVLEWAPGAAATSGWSTDGIALAGNGLTPVNPGVLGSWTSAPTSQGYYTLRLTVNNGTFFSVATTVVYAEPGLISAAWPKSIGPFKYDHGAQPLRQPDGTSRLLVGGYLNAAGSTLSSYGADGSVVSVPLQSGSQQQAVVGNLDGQPGDEVVLVDGPSLKIYSSNLVMRAAFVVISHGLFLADQPILADIDGDGLPEIVAIGRDTADGVSALPTSPAYLFVFRQDGTLFSPNFPVLLASPVGNGSIGPGGTRLLAVDLNGDGRKEIVVILHANGPSAYTVRVVGGDGSVYSNWQAPTYFGFVAESLSAADLDHNGTPEIVIAESTVDQSAHRILVLNNTSAVRAGWPVTLSSNISLAIGDLARDQHNEIVAAADRTLTILRDDGTLWIPAIPIGDQVNGVTNTTPLIADIDGDGLPEILLASATFSSGPDPQPITFLTAFRQNGTVQQTWPLFGLNGLLPFVAVPVVGDFNGDGKTDVVVQVALTNSGQLNGASALTWLTTGTNYNAAASDWTTNYRDPQNSRTLPPSAAFPSAPHITTQPLPQTVAVGGTATFTAAAVGIPAPTYQWQRFGTDIPGATNSTLVRTNVQASDSGSAYRMVATNASGSVVTLDVILTVVAPAIPVFTVQPQAQTISVGNTAIFTAIAVGNPAPTYQWQRNGTNIPGETGTTLFLYNVPASENGANYRSIATNPNGSTISNNVVLTVPAPAIPVFTTQPQAQTVSAGSAAAFTAIAVGTPMPTYQWQRNGTNIAGATSTTLNLPSVPQSENGTNYRSIATNPNGSTTSNTVVLTVATMPAITTQPVSRTVLVGANVTFTAAASGSPAPTFQWQKDGSNLPGALSASLALTNVQVTDTGSYRVIAANPAGSIASTTATLTVNAPPVFTLQPPPAQYMAPGVDHSFFVLATGTPSPTYQWQKNGVNIPGATNPRLDLPNVQSTDGGTYRAIATNSVKSTASNNMVLTVVVAPTFTKQPVGKAVTAGTNLTLTVTATGTPTPFLQWQKDGVPITGATTASLSLVNVQPGDSGTYDVVAYNLGGSTTSNPAVVTVNIPPAFTTQPPNTFVALVGVDVILTAEATGTPEPTYRWQKNGANIAGATNSTLALTNIQLSNAGTYRAIATNAGGSATSISTVLTVVAPPVITKQPVNKTVTVGTTVTLTVAASGTPAPTFQWQKDGIVIDGATSASLVLTGVQLGDAAIYTAIATNQGGSVVSNGAVVTVNELPVITTQPTDWNARVGDTVFFFVGASGTPAATYRWQKNGVNIAGATDSMLTLTNVALSAAGTYRVIASNAAGSATSVGAVLTVSAPPVITSQTGSRIVNPGATTTFSVTVTGTPAPTFQWFFEGSPITGATSRTLTLANVQAGNAGVYWVMVNNVAGTVYSDNVALTVNSPPAFTTQPSSQEVYSSNLVTFYATATGIPDPTYQWQKNGVNISGATSSILTLPNPTLASAGTYRAIAKNAAGSTASADAVLAVDLAPTFTSQPVDKTVSADTSVTFTAVVTGFPAPTLQWQKNGQDIIGATSASLTLNSVQLADAGSYLLIATNGFGTNYSNAVVLVVKAKPVFVTPPADQSVSVGGSAIFQVEVTGFPTPTIKWQKNGVTISGATGPMFVVNNAQASSAATYTAIATNSVGATTSTGAILTVLP